jgi:hypothetical protein
MLRKLTFASVAAVGVLAGSAMPALAQPSVGVRVDLGLGRGSLDIGVGRPAYPAIVAPVVPVAPIYRPVEHHYHVQWRSLVEDERSFDCHEDAHRFAERKRRQGYEARVIHHRSHFHVRYRLPVWETYRTVAHHREAHDLAAYLRSRGYEARVVHH